MICLSVSLIAVLSGCQIDQNDILEDPTVEEVGYIVAGDQGNRFVHQDFGSFPVLLSLADGGGSWDIDLDSANGDFVRVFGSSSNSATYSYSSVLIFASSGIQFTTRVVSDSVWRCENWPIDSSTGSINEYNTLSELTCNGTSLHFKEMDTRDAVLMYDAGQRIDATLPWGSSGALFWVSNSEVLSDIYPSGAYVYISRIRKFTFWKDGVARYVPFRWLSQDRYHYGYVKVSANAGGAKIYGYAYEK